MDFAWSDDEDNDEALVEISAQLEENEVQATQTDCFPEDLHTSHFVCTGCDLPSSTFHSVSFVQNNDHIFNNHGRRINLQEYSIFNICASAEVLLEKNLIRTLFLMAKTTALELKCGKKLPRAILESNYTKRMHITSLLHYTRSFFQSISREELLKNLKLLESIVEAEDSIPSTNILPTIHSSPSSATHHFFHGSLEWRWLILTILALDYRANAQESDFRECQSWEKLLTAVNLLIFDLLRISLNKFNGLKLPDILLESPFHCVCVKELWFLIISLLETFKEKISFWEIFSSSLSSLVTSETNKISNIRPSSSKCENPQIFTIWVVLQIVKLQEVPRGIPRETLENVDLLDKTVKSFFTEDPSELEVRVGVRLTATLILNYWPCAIDVIVQFWEHFHKKINTNFYIPSDGMNSLLVPNDSAMSYIKTAKQIPETSLGSLPATQTSYATFCNTIGHFLHNFSQTDFMRNFQKITGRIFIKFTTKKWQSMNETGIHNITSLLLVLATMGDEKIIERVESICLLIPLQELSTSRQLAASKSLVALLILSFRQLRASQYPGKLIAKLNLEKCDTQTPQGVLKVFAHGMCEIFAESELCGEEHILVGPWIGQYLKSCAENDREFLLNHLNKTLVRIQGIIARGDEVANLQELLRAFFSHVLPYVKGEYESNGGILWLPELTGNLCLAASGQNGLPRIEELFSNFMEMNCKNPKYLFTLFSMVATSNKASVLNPGILIHHWIRCMVFCSSASSEDLRMATEAIASLPELQDVCSINREEFLASKEPFYAFLFGIGQKYQQLENPRDKMALSNKFHNYVKSFEKYALQGLSTQDGASNVYRTIAVIVLHCSHIIYVPMKTNCFLRILVAEFILPAALLLGKTQSAHVVKAMMKIFPVFLEGIAKLDFKGDQYLTKLISDIILNWTPHFKTTTSASMAAKPFVKCLTSKQLEMGVAVIEKFCEGFFPQTPRKGTSNASLAVNVLREIFLQTSGLGAVFETLLDVTCLPLMDHVLMSDDFAPSKKLILDLLEFIFKGQVYREQAKYRQIVVRGLMNLTTNKLSFQTSSYFLFMLKMAQVNPMAVRDVLPYLKDQIVDVEFRRGSGRDARLRQQLNTLENAVAKDS